MRLTAPLAWLQLKREPARFSVAVAGVAFAVILVFMQFGFYDALFRSAVRLHEHLQADLVLISPKPRGASATAALGGASHSAATPEGGELADGWAAADSQETRSSGEARAVHCAHTERANAVG